ncbi:NAD(P)-dependent oxidoreductase [Micromonospora globbae]|uniref:NADH-flavin reductase n=1 Tax=Micromonospora globbae TaxID=1894969 RepID=A0A420F0L7_9ACTN|nr:NAD(P)H-binding protein [Micromonospora globbae]RKF26480.1 NADH-flavin reductase [Micromonospora globbae]
MPSTPDQLPKQVAVLGAGGRVGRAVTAALLAGEHHVTAVVRDPGRYDPPPHPRLRVVRGDARQPAPLAPVLRTTEALVLAVTPFTAPPPSFDGFDPDYYAAIVAGLADAWDHPHRRLVAVGLTATLRLDSGGAVMDDPDLFPPALTPYAEAHARQLPALSATTLDWAVLAPPGGFGTDPDPRRPYRLLREPLSRTQVMAALSHGTYARAVVAEVERPTVRRERVAVVPG